MVRMKYCPNCGSMDYKNMGFQIQCMRCKYLGEPKQDSMDVINDFRKRLKGRPLNDLTIKPPAAENENNTGTLLASENTPNEMGTVAGAARESQKLNEKKEMLKKKFGNSDDFEFV